MTQELKPCPFCGGSAIDCGKDDICCTTPGCSMANKYIPLKGWNTRASPPAPSSDVETDIGTVECIGRCLGGAFERDLLAHAKRIRAHIAALEAENKRLLDALAYIANTDPDDGGSREFPDYVGSLEVCHEKAREALSSHKTQEVIGKQPEPQKCVTCGGRGWEYSPMENTKVDCMNCNGTGKAGE